MFLALGPGTHLLGDVCLLSGPQLHGCLRQIRHLFQRVGPWPPERVHGALDLGQTSWEEGAEGLLANLVLALRAASAFVPRTPVWPCRP